MKKYQLILMLGIGVGMTSVASAATVCGTTGVACVAPAATAQGTLTLNTANILGIQSLNSGSTDGNDTTSNYYFAASHTDLGATVANNGINNSGTGLVVEGVTPSHPASATPGSAVTAGRIDGLKGGTVYFLYVQACPQGSADNSSNCSSWVRVDAASHSTQNYQATIFINPTRPNDATVNSIAIRTNVPAGDVSSVGSIDNITINDIITPARNQSISNIAFVGNPGPYTVDNSLYTTGFKPNNKYTYSAQVAYPWDDVPVAGVETRPSGGGAFWTTPENPGVVSAGSITHCSAIITAHNSGVATPNPTYTEYSLCATGNCVTSGRINGTPVPSDTVSATVSPLAPNTTYTPKATAKVGNQDGTETSWNSSGVTNGTDFTTLDWSLTTGIGPGVSTTSATYTVVLGNSAGLTGYQIFVNGAGQGFVSAASVPANIGITGLTPNTPYTITIVLSEASCDSLPIGSQTFTTTAATPVPTTFTSPTPRSLTATWTDSLNPSGTVYEFEYCTDAGFSVACHQVLVTNPTKTVTVTDGVGGQVVSPETSYYGHVRARNINRPTWADSPYAAFASNPVTTGNEVPSLNVTVQVWTTSATLVAVSTDAAGASNLVFNWTAAVGTLDGTAPTGTSVNSGITATNTIQVMLGVGGTANGNVTVRDHSGSGLSNTKPWSTNASHIATSITISPTSATVQTGKTQVFNATVLDQFGATITNAAVVWSVSGGGSVAPTPSSFTVFSAATPGTFTLTASSAPAPAAHATITVVAAGPFFTQTPTIALNPDHVTALGAALGTDNVTGTTGLVYTWSVVSGPAVVAFSPNATGGAHDTTLTFNTAGTYVIQCTLSNANGTISASTSTFVPQFGTTSAVTPASVQMQTLSTQQFTATGKDQFSKPYTLTGVTWTASAGNIGMTTGIFTAPAMLSNTVITITATPGGSVPPGTATVTLVDYNISGAHAFPVPYKASMGLANGICFTGIGSGADIQIFTPSGHKVFDKAVNPQNPGTVPTATNCDGFSWNLENSSGEKVASGVYFFEVKSSGNKKDGKLIIIQ